MTTDPTNVLMGIPTPRLWTPPLRPLTPETSKGFAVIEFARALGITFMPWQEWLLIHALELNEDGTYRFRTVHVLVSRQNGKTTVLKVLALWRMIEDGAEMVLGTSTNLEYARESWNGSVNLITDFDEANGTELVTQVKYGAVDTVLILANKSRYKIASATRRGGRSLSVDLGIADELREHDDWSAWAALSGTTTARPDPQLWALSNAGDHRSVVLNRFRSQGMAFIETGEGDPHFAHFEWSAPDDCELDDRDAWAQANPALGHTITEATLVAKSSLPPEVFRTEHLCQSVVTEKPAVDPAAWADCADASGSMETVRSRVVLGIDVSPDLRHVSLVAAALLDDGRVRVESVAAWDSTAQARSDLPGWMERIKPRSLVWFANGPAAALAADLAQIKGAEQIPSGDVGAICQGFAEQTEARRLVHSDDPMLTAQVLGVSKTDSGDGWRFTRKGAGHCDAVYAAAGAVHQARMKTRVGKPRVLMPT